MEKRAYKERIIYQIYPLSFKDSNNDGYGDLKGIIQKLDYLKELGVGMIWLSPIYNSPMKDNGYDISDYYKINPLFGTMEDFDTLLEEAKKRDIKIVMDLVVNHTSDQHPWFQEALKNKDSKYRGYYYFRKGNGKKPPNNWNSAFSGSCWEKVPNEGNMYYLHLFTKEQPDLNYHNEEVIKEVENILKFYLDKGVAGFRCDVISQIYKTSLENGKFSLFSRGREHYENQEGAFKILERFRREVLDKYDDVFLVGETSSLTPKIGQEFIDRRALDMFFEFDHAFCKSFKLVPIFKKPVYKAKLLFKPIFKWQKEVSWIGAYLENHDQLRSVSRFGDEKKFFKESAKALSLFLLSLKGTIFIYQGQEIGTLNYKNLTYEETDDCMAKNATETAMKILHVSKRRAFKWVNDTVNRDHARAPFQWDDSINGGFNEGHQTWIKINDNYKNINVKNEVNDKNSILNFYKKMIHFRNHSDTLKYGSFEEIKSNSYVAKFLRRTNDETLLIVANLSNKQIKDKKLDETKEILVSNYDKHENKVLKPFEAIIYKIK